MLRSLHLATAVVACLVVGGTVWAGDTVRDSVLGRKAENFSLNDFYGKTYSLADFKDKKLVVLAFVGTECPVAKAYGPRLAELAKKYADKGVQFLGVSSNRQDTITELSAFARVHHIEFPILKDLNNKLADQLGAQRTPEVFVLDQDRSVRYHGRIDNQFGVGYAKKTASEPFLQSALDELLAGRPVSKGETAAVGCFIGRVHTADAGATVTYSNQVVRILNKRCVSCHRRGEAAPFAMTTYGEVSGWADAIAEVVRQHRMPPWLASPKYGHFANDRSMPDEEKEILYQWAAAGAPEGNAKDLPPAPTFVEGWALPKAPDKIYKAQRFHVPATGVIDYQYFRVDPGFKEDKWISAIEARPSNRAVVHHIIVFAGRKGGLDEARRQFLVGYAPGAVPLILPPGMAKLIPAGSELVFQVHYTPNGKAGDDISECGIVFADPKEVRHLVRTVDAVNAGFEIPPGAENYEVDSDSFALPMDGQLLQLFPHMHFRGKSFTYEAVYPDGHKEIVLDVPRYDFGWQLSYQLTSPLPMPKGTRMHCVAHFDNSENNLNNPDPKSTVRWGDQTWEEMMIGFHDIAVPVTQEEIKEARLPDFSPRPEQMAQRFLQQFDKNHDGKIQMSELPSQPLRLKIIFAMLDKNHDGVITLEELAQGLKERQRQGGRGLGLRRSGGVRGDRANNPSKPADQKDVRPKDQASVK
ncbi:MAG TPA: redoxin domain-containing protein [Planctomycetaceae bacterium]|jgi:peroxiredoxin|nr:redoxin domain-containing protein [Planctomycetaceae bacterium]